MDAGTDVLADSVRAKRIAIDNDLELLRVRLAEADPRRRIDAGQVLRRAWPWLAAAAAVFIARARRRRVTSLEQLLVHGLSDLHRTEHEVAAALDWMRARAWDADVERVFAQHRMATGGHIERLERVFRSVGARPGRGSSSAARAIVADAERLLARRVDRHVRDAWLIATLQRLAHLEMATYGTVRAYAGTLGFTFAAELLQQTLEDLRAADERLSHLAERFVNPQSIRTAATR